LRGGELIGKLETKDINNHAYIKNKNKVLQNDQGTIGSPCIEDIRHSLKEGKKEKWFL